MFVGCREPYDPALENKVISYLVVEGNINASGVTTIEISRTQRLSEKEVRKFETGASVEIESDNSTKYVVSDRGKGLYTSAANTLPKDRKYRLRIKTTMGKEYLSEFAAVKVTQPVTVSWSKDANGVEILANTTDPTKQSQYYQWLTEETWEIQSPLPTFFVVLRPSIVVDRRSAQDRIDASLCWTTVRSANILTATTRAQSDDLIKGFSLQKIPNGSERLSVRYSVLVSQYAISKEAYEFYEVLKKNTEKLGSVFDPQPSLVRGNITCTTDPEEIVIGFIDCSIPTTQRIFITSKEAGDWKSSLVCQPSYLQNTLTAIRGAFPNDETMISTALIADYPSSSGGEIILGYNIVKADCVDCRLRGNNIRPSFW